MHRASTILLCSILFLSACGDQSGTGTERQVTLSDGVSLCIDTSKVFQQVGDSDDDIIHLLFEISSDADTSWIAEVWSGGYHPQMYVEGFNIRQREALASHDYDRTEQYQGWHAVRGVKAAKTLWLMYARPTGGEPTDEWLFENTVAVCLDAREDNPICIAYLHVDDARVHLQTSYEDLSQHSSWPALIREQALLPKERCD